jgi:hypothetical protein
MASSEDLKAELQAEREARIQQLEQRLERRSGVGVKVPVAVAAILMSVLLLYAERLELAYLFAPRAPLKLGHEGEYRFDELRSNRYAQVHGIPTARGTYAREGDETYVVVGLRDTPLLVRRRALPQEEWSPGTTPPQPDQRPFAVGGRLLAQGDADRYRDGFAKHLAFGETRPLNGQLWILLEGERPGGDRGGLLFALALLLFAGLNTWFLYRELRHRFGRSAA